MLEQKQKQYNWYYTQCFPRGGGKEYNGALLFVTFAETPSEAKSLAVQHVNRLHPEYDLLGDRDIRLYQKNYIRQARSFVETGNYCGIKPSQV